ncbi:MAG: hypothetical protein ACLUAR_19905 [Pilosibacter sp.]
MCSKNPDDQIFKYNVMDEIMFGPMNIGMDPKRARGRGKACFGVDRVNRQGEGKSS